MVNAGLTRPKDGLWDQGGTVQDGLHEGRRRQPAMIRQLLRREAVVRRALVSAYVLPAGEAIFRAEGVGLTRSVGVGFKPAPTVDPWRAASARFRTDLVGARHAVPLPACDARADGISIWLTTFVEATHAVSHSFRASRGERCVTLTACVEDRPVARRPCCGCVPCRARSFHRLRTIRVSPVAAALRLDGTGARGALRARAYRRARRCSVWEELV
jgi:hypothetical protein